MAGFFQQVLKGAATGLVGDAYLRDFTHASKTFVTNGFANAPKFKYLFHVYFELNDVLMSANGGAQSGSSIIPGLLVKQIDLPKFQITTAELNQYNRPRNIQTKIAYDPVNITFHDDHAGTITRLWYDYYSYYYGDPISTANNKNGKMSVSNLYSKDISDDQNWGYAGEPSDAGRYGLSRTSLAKPHFFKSVKIYGLSQHAFISYTLVNPMIERFQHDTYDYNQPSGVMENKMALKYESVLYESGAINGDEPGSVVSGFGSTEYYDRTLSPISRPGSNKTIMGQGGLIDAADGFLNDLSSGNLIGAAQKALTVQNTWKNPSAVLTAVKQNLVAGATGVAVAGLTQVARSALTFPTQGSTTGGAQSQNSASSNLAPTTPPPVTPP